MTTFSKAMLVVWLLTLSITQIRVYADQKAFCQSFIVLLNHHRIDMGLRPLLHDTMLTKSARWYSEICANREKISHDFAKDYEKLMACGKLTRWYDNVNECLQKSIDFPRADWILEAFLSSPPHRDSLMDPDADHIGLFYTENNGYSYTVVYVGDDYGD